MFHNCRESPSETGIQLFRIACLASLTVPKASEFAGAIFIVWKDGYIISLLQLVAGKSSFNGVHLPIALVWESKRQANNVEAHVQDYQSENVSWSNEIVRETVQDSNQTLRR